VAYFVWYHANKGPPALWHIQIVLRRDTSVYTTQHSGVTHASGWTLC
jgi:hypothetical protein